MGALSGKSTPSTHIQASIALKMATDKYQPSYEVTGNDSNESPSSRSDVEIRDRRLSHVDIARITKVSSVITVLVSGLALFSDGYNAQIIGYERALPYLPTLSHILTNMLGTWSLCSPNCTRMECPAPSRLGCQTHTSSARSSVCSSLASSLTRSAAAPGLCSRLCSSCWGLLWLPQHMAHLNLECSG